MQLHLAELDAADFAADRLGQLAYELDGAGVLVGRGGAADVVLDAEDELIGGARSLGRGLRKP